MMTKRELLKRGWRPAYPAGVLSPSGEHMRTAATFYTKGRDGVVVERLTSDQMHDILTGEQR